MGQGDRGGPRRGGGERITAAALAGEAVKAAENSDLRRGFRLTGAELTSLPLDLASPTVDLVSPAAVTCLHHPGKRERAGNRGGKRRQWLLRSSGGDARVEKTKSRGGKQKWAGPAHPTQHLTYIAPDKIQILMARLRRTAESTSSPPSAPLRASCAAAT